MKSKAFHAFEQRLHYFNDDLDLIDVLRVCVLSEELTDTNSNKVLKNVDENIHKHLSRRANKAGSRQLIIDHLRNTLHAAYIKDIYEEVTEYLKKMLTSAAREGIKPDRIIGEHGFKKDAKEILAAGNWENIVQMISDSIFQSLEAERSTLSLLQKISNKLALHVEQGKIDNALPYLEIRHFLVHTNGKVPRKFQEKYLTIVCDAKNYVNLDREFIKNFASAVHELIYEYDQKIIAARMLRDEDLHLAPRLRRQAT